MKDYILMKTEIYIFINLPPFNLVFSFPQTPTPHIHKPQLIFSYVRGVERKHMGETIEKQKKITKKEEQQMMKERISQEKDRLDKIYKNIPSRKYKTVIKLIENIAFMTVTLEMLVEEINKTNLTVKTKNASQEFIKESPALAAYNKMYANFLKGIQQLNSLLPPDEPSNGSQSTPEDSFEKFVYQRNHRK